MKSSNHKDKQISIDQIQVGLYVHLDLGWMDHPFKFNNFKIQNQEQVEQIKKLGLKTVIWEPERSDVHPLTGASADLAATKPEIDKADEEINEPGKTQYSKIRKNINAVEKAFMETSIATENILKKISTNPQESVQEASQLVAGITQTMSDADDLSLHMVSSSNNKQSIQTHSLNVTVLATAFAQYLKLTEEQKLSIGIGSMLHDIGLSKLPERFIRNIGPLTNSELQVRKHHCQYGQDLIQTLNLSSIVNKIIIMHHEYFDGSGYPNSLTGDQIPYEVQIVSLVNFYERLCSPINMQNSVTAHDALSLLYRKHKQQFEPALLKSFIQFMGIYPPGSIVSLSDEKIGIIIKVFSSAPLRPMLMVYNEDIPKRDALILDLREVKDINITKSINPSLLSSSLRDYLSPQERTNYYFDSE